MNLANLTPEELRKRNPSLGFAVAACNSDSESDASTTTTNETTNTAISDSYNTSNYSISSLSDIGNVTVSGVNTDRFPVLLAGIVGAVVILVVFIRRNK